MSSLINHFFKVKHQILLTIVNTSKIHRIKSRDAPGIFIVFYSMFILITYALTASPILLWAGT